MATTFNRTESKELSKLININEDACEFYDTACQKVQSRNLKSTFLNLKAVHKGIVVNLQTYLNSRPHSGNPSATQTMIGQAKQLWGEVSATIGQDTDEIFVSHLEEAEDRCLNTMADAIDNEGISPDVRRFLGQELGTLKEAHDFVHLLRMSLNAA